MPLAGKLLLAFNLLAAAGLVYLATQDWARRQDLAAVELQYYLALHGLPVEGPEGAASEAIPFPVETSGGQVVETVRPQFVTEYLKSANGGEKLGAAGDQPIATQLAEVKRVQEKLNAMLRALPAKERLDRLCGRGSKEVGLLIRLAESFSERDALAQLNLSATPQTVAEHAAKAEAILKRKFEAVLAPPNPKLASESAERIAAATEALRAAIEPRQTAEANYLKALADKNNPMAVAQAEAQRQAAEAALTEAYTALTTVLADTTGGASLDDRDRRRQIAHLLTLADPSGEWQTRTARIIGLKEYQRAVAEQIARLRDMTRSVERQIESDQASFVERYEQLRLLAYDRAGLAQEQEGISKTLAAIKRHDEEDVLRREAEYQRLQETLAEVKKEVAAKLAAQAEVEQRLLEMQKAVGETLRANLELEEKLDTAELSRAKF